MAAMKNDIFDFLSQSRADIRKASPNHKADNVAKVLIAIAI